MGQTKEYLEKRLSDETNRGTLLEKRLSDETNKRTLLENSKQLSDETNKGTLLAEQLNELQAIVYNSTCNVSCENQIRGLENQVEMVKEVLEDHQDTLQKAVSDRHTK